jgi:tripartite-type tricarboxylate transporter receptor subunit TctC
MAPQHFPSRIAWALVLAMHAGLGGAQAQSVEDFYTGRNVALVVSSDAGGTTGLYGRTIGEFLGRHIPGQPNVVMQFMSGGGGIRGTNYCYNIAPKDGSVICHIQAGLPLVQLLNPRGVRYDVRDFSYLGRTSSTNSGIYVWHTQPVETLLDVRDHEVILGASGRGSETYNDPTIINNVLGTKFNVILGYEGGGDIDLALERGEITGDAGQVLSVFVRKQYWLQDGLIRFLVQTGRTRHERLPDVPLLQEFARNAEERAVFEFLSSRADIGMTLLVPPDVPDERVSALRQAMADTLADPDFLAAAEQRNLDVVPATAEEVEASVRSVFETPAPVVERIRAALELE